MIGNWAHIQHAYMQYQITVYIDLKSGEKVKNEMIGLHVSNYNK